MSTFARFYYLFVSRINPLGTVFLLTFLAAIPAAAQSSVSGCVEDESGAVIIGARIVMRTADGSPLGQTVSDKSGCFRFEGVRSGPGNVRVLAEAFSLHETDLDVVGQVELAPIVLELQPIRNSVTVTANRTPISEAALGVSVEVIGRTEIEATRTRNAGDVLRHLAGFAVQQTGNAGGISNFFVRGGESDYNKVLIDGVPLNSPGDAYDFAHVPADNVTRIEVVRGPQSALFGSDAISSVVQIFTRRGTPSPEATYSLEAGSFDTLRQSASLSGSFESFDFSNTFSRLDTDNLDKNDDFRNAAYFGNFGFAPGDDHTLRLTVSRTSGRAGTPGPTAEGFTSFDPTGSMERLEQTVGLAYNVMIGPRWNQHASYRFHDLDQTFFGSFGPFPVASRRHRVEYLGEVLVGYEGTLSYGLDFDREQGPVSGLAHDRDNFGFYVQQQIEPVRDFHLTAGIRVDDNNSFGTMASPRLAASYRLWTGSGHIGLGRLRAAFGRGIKEPRFLESFSTSPFFLGNPDLEAERSRSWEIGLEQGFADDRVLVDVTWFDNRFENVIQLVGSDDGTSQYQNIGLTSARGLEVRGRVRNGRLRATSNYTYLEGSVRESSAVSFPFRPGDPLLRRPTHSGDIRLMWLDDDWQATWSSRVVGERADSDFFSHFPPLTSNVAYTVSDAAFTVRLPGNMSAFITIDNIFNRQYQEVLGFEALGRGFTVGTRLRVGGAQ